MPFSAQLFWALLWYRWVIEKTSFRFDHYREILGKQVACSRNYLTATCGGAPMCCLDDILKRVLNIRTYVKIFPILKFSM